MSRESDINALHLTETIPPLALAPLAGLAVLTCAALPRTGPADVPIVALYIAPFFNNKTLAASVIFGRSATHRYTFL
jgi:hypothetical protein